MRSVTNSEIAAVFDHVADLLEYQGGNVFRVRAYRNAAHTIGGLVEPLATVRADTNRALTDLDGIGDDLAGKIEGLLDTGRLPLLEELKSQGKLLEAQRLNARTRFDIEMLMEAGFCRGLARRR